MLTSGKQSKPKLVYECRMDEFKYNVRGYMYTESRFWPLWLGCLDLGIHVERWTVIFSIPIWAVWSKVWFWANKWYMHTQLYGAGQLRMNCMTMEVSDDFRNIFRVLFVYQNAYDSIKDIINMSHLLLIYTEHVPNNWPDYPGCL